MGASVIACAESHLGLGGAAAAACEGYARSSRFTSADCGRARPFAHGLEDACGASLEPGPCLGSRSSSRRVAHARHRAAVRLRNAAVRVENRGKPPQNRRKARGPGQPSVAIVKPFGGGRCQLAHRPRRSPADLISDTARTPSPTTRDRRRGRGWGWSSVTQRRWHSSASSRGGPRPASGLSPEHASVA